MSAPTLPNPKQTESRLLGLSLTSDDWAVAAVVDALQKSGVSPESIYTDLLIPVARGLGEMWENDECTFADVTTGLLRLQNAQRVLSPAFRGTPKNDERRPPRVLLMPLPGEQHTFGLTIVADHFARAGWDTWHGAVKSEAQAVKMVREEHVDLVGLSFACEDQITTAARLVANIRRRAANPQMLVMVGGPLLVADPELAARVGADGTAVDGQQAVERADNLLGERFHSLSS